MPFPYSILYVQGGQHGLQTRMRKITILKKKNNKHSKSNLIGSGDELLCSRAALTAGAQSGSAMDAVQNGVEQLGHRC